jgi:hypothetical protein
VSPDRHAAAGCAEDGRLDAYLEVAEDCGRREDSVSSDSSSSTDALLTSVPPPTVAALPNLTEFRSEVRAMHSDSDHEDFEGSSSSWSCDSVSGVIPTRHVRPLRGSLRRPPMPDWSPPSFGAAKAAPAASTASTDSTDSSCGPTSQSPIRRKRQSAGRRPRSMEVSSPRELSPATRADLASVEVFPCCLEFGHVVQWCRQVRTVSVHNPSSRFSAQLHGGIITDGNQGAPYALQLDNGWPTLPPMSTVVLQVRACSVGAVSAT